MGCCQDDDDDDVTFGEVLITLAALGVIALAAYGLLKILEAIF